ncbi:endonuclease NucS domain-containing protein [Bacteroidota bacterium]
MFKKGSQYTRKDIGWILLPETGRPKGGNWDTGYVVVNDLLIVFMNIGVPGKTDHDFDNDYDEESGLITWFGKPNTHSKQPLFEKLLDRKLTPHFFARWDNSDPKFTYLGIGSVVKYDDSARTRSGIEAIKLLLSVDDVEYILPSTDEKKDTTSSFMFEKHLEDFLIKNWEKTHLAKKYSIHTENNVMVGRQYHTDTGPLDILALSKDGREFLVVELKRDRASDEVVGQTLRYMGWVKRNLCANDQDVKGCIVALKGDAKLENALHTLDSISFVRYEVDFRLINEY